MPISLDTVVVTQKAGTTKKIHTPKFFHRELTGVGKNGGLIRSTMTPNNPPESLATVTLPRNIIEKSSETNVSTTERRIPVAPIISKIYQEYQNGNLVPFPKNSSEVFFLNENDANRTKDAYLWLMPESLVFRKNETIANELFVNYSLFVRTVPRDTDIADDYGTLIDVSQVNVLTTYHVMEGIDTLVSVHYSVDDLNKWLDTYNLYETLCDQAETWSTERLADDLVPIIESLGQQWKNHPQEPYTNMMGNLLVIEMKMLENYNVSLDSYQRIYEALSQNLPQDMIDVITKYNLNLLMTNTLQMLQRDRAQTISLPPEPQPFAGIPAHYSVQQKNACHTEEKFALVQAGAGTGKTSAIMGRIENLFARGVLPEDILVLSFTNAAADNVKARNPRIGSMTIAKMIHEIYVANHPTHAMSSIDTILNSLGIFFPTNACASELSRLLMRIAENKPGAQTDVNAFVEANYDNVIAILDTIRQVCLELEIILCYQRIDTLPEPAGFQAKYLIIDEVQDNSIFEFIYSLRYVLKHHAQLFIVGDSSQTLYEFRASNPKALNTLEKSGVFATFQLTTNYRSNQEILDFANVTLSNIEANQYANIQLQSNSFDLPTKDSFTEKVTLDYRFYQREADFRDDFDGIMMNTIFPKFVAPAIAKGEKVAFLSYSRNFAFKVEKLMKLAFPTEEVANMTSEKSYSSTTFSVAIREFWNAVCAEKPENASFALTTLIQNNMTKFIPRGTNDEAEKAVLKFVSDWWVENSPIINQWVAETKNGTLDTDTFFNNLRQNLLDFEVARNGQRLNMVRLRNNQRKEKNLNSNAKLITSTVHGAKGLEFDHVIVLHNYKADMAEDMKRLYYVAFTRAMKSEYILSYGKSPRAIIEDDYDNLVKALEERENAGIVDEDGNVLDVVPDTYTDSPDDTDDDVATTDTEDDAE